jgi:hypothetical protein
MMRIFFFLLFLVLITIVVPLAASRLLRITNKTIWKSTLLEYGSKYFIYSILFFVLVWIVGFYSGSRAILLTGVTGTSTVMMISFILIATLPVSIAYQKIHHWLEASRRVTVVNPERRQVLKTGAALLPLLALGSTGTGVARSFQNIRIKLSPI